MNIRQSALAGGALIVACAAVGVWAWSRLPADALIAVHFNARGDPDRFANKSLGLSLMPAIGAVVVAILTVLPSIAPRRKNLAASAGAYGTVMVGVAAVFLVAQGAMVARSMDAAFDILRWLFAAIGILFVVVGNLLGKIRHNYVLGIRTPWAFANERVWDKTHRVTGRLMVLAGAALALGSALIHDHRLIIGLLVACAAGPAIAGTIYSWRTYRNLGQS